MVKNQLVKNQSKSTLSVYLTQDSVKKHINSVLGSNSGQRFMASIISAVQATPTLQECTNQSIVSAALLGESLKLSPSPQLGQYYLVPFNDSKRGCKVAQFQIGYKGYIQLAIRSGQYKKLNALAIKEGELVRYNPLEEEIEVVLIDNEQEREKAKTIGYYAMFEYTNGFKKAIYWSKEKMQSHALKYSKGYQAQKGFTFWEKDFDGMAIKTMLRQLISKWGIMSIELEKAITSDMAVVNDDGSYEYVDDAEMIEAEYAVEDAETVQIAEESENVEDALFDK